jgi:hypothetical protein
MQKSASSGRSLAQDTQSTMEANARSLF